HPYAVVFLNVVPDTIDVNIHPQKLQVKFSEPQVVYNELARAVRETLRQFTGYQLYVDKRDSALFASEPPVENSNGKDVRNVQSDWQDGKRASDWRNERNGSFSGTNATGQSRSRDANTYYPVNRSDDSAGNIQLDGTFGQKISTLQRIGKFTILRNRYILFEDVDGIVIVDFHAAHERIIYERLKEKTYSTVPLLIPIEVSLPKSVEQVLDELKDALEGAGFTFSIEEGKVKITQIPSILNVTQARDVFMEVLEEYRLPFDKPKSLNHVLASKACKAAIKTGDPISESEAEQLVNEVREKGLLTCPHGRPILMKLTFSQLDSYFERI
ncbi:MAG TPA: DNA mismatch repair protein MutL, partial [Fervidobacterium sp.]|nr:DNA mismatch repair protein MutL [Fervidobacterium sp.]